MTDQLEITMTDVQELFRVNPLAAEQAKVIALNRQLREQESEKCKLEQRLAELEKTKE